MRSAKDVDDYIANASDCTRPILVELRCIFRQASPPLQEAIKWGVPCYSYRGMVGGFAAYQSHVSWGLWKARLLNDPDGIIGRDILRGGKIATLSEIPPKSKFLSLINQAIALNEAGVKHPKPLKPKAPSDLAAALKDSDEASKHYAAFNPARQWQYVNWITGARRPETRARRIKTAIERLAKGQTMK